MPKYPVNIPIPPYLSEKLSPQVAKQHAMKIENHINECLKDAPARILDYSEIAAAIGLDMNIVRDFLLPIGGGQKGIVIDNPSFDENP